MLKQRCVPRQILTPNGAQPITKGWYWNYLYSPWWQERRRERMKKNERENNGMCNFCWRRKATAIHHPSYEHLGREPDADLIPTCKQCHDRLHPEWHAANDNDQFELELEEPG